MIGQNLSKLLKTTKNLLAFSGGVDSSALFFALLEARVEFDIAIVDYNERASSKDEVAYAASLAEKYGKKIYQHSASLGTSDFENSARKVRHQFFEKIIKENNYAVLLTAHQLNDRLEWFLMRFTVGAGVNSLVGMREIDERDGYIIVRPLLGVSRDEIVDFLTKKSITYFEDESNLDERFTRNAFRNRHSNELVSSFSTGIKRSFEILEQESDFLYGKTKIFQQEELYIIEISNSLQLLYSLDYIAKKFGYLLSFEQKKEFLKTKSSVFGGKICAEVSGELLFISPYQKTKLSKELKEESRISGLPPKVRGYAASMSMSPASALRLARDFFAL